MGLLSDALSGKTARVNKLLNTNANLLLGRVNRLPDPTLVGDWCYSSVLESSVFLKGLLFEDPHAPASDSTFVMNPSAGDRRS